MSITMQVGADDVPGVDASGRPDPGYAASLGIVPAPAGRRAAAFALDAAVWTVLAVLGLVGAVLLLPLLTGAPTPAPGDLVLPIVLLATSQVLLTGFAIVQIALHGRRGVTLGKAAAGLRSVQVATFGPAGFWRIALRTLVLWASQTFLPFIGPAVLFASASWDPERRGRSWLDRVGRCWLVDARAGLDPFDGRALRHARRSAGAPRAEWTPPRSLASDRAHVDRPVPVPRSTAGVVSARAGSAGEWAPPELGAREAPDAPRAVVVFDDGTREELRAPMLIGRNPAASPGDPSVRLVAVDDPTMNVSKTHVAVEIDLGGVWVTDRGSSNGSRITSGGATTPLVAWRRTRLAPGDTVRIGGRAFRVETDGRAG